MTQAPATRTNKGGTLTKRSEHPLQRMRQDFDTFFRQTLGGWLTPFDQELESMRMWDFDVTENDQEIAVRAELPGFEENELDVQINNDLLTIKAEKEQKDDQHTEYRNFYRTITLPAGVNVDKVQATYHNGVLELHMPRKEGSQPKHIKVEGHQNGNGQQGMKQSSEKAKK